MQDDLIEWLRALHVWPQSIADMYADTLTPRQTAKLYEVGNVSHEAADRITALEAKLAEKDALLRECGEALAEYACHGGPDLPCIRSKDQCRTECGKIAGDTLAKIKDATDG